MVTELYIVFKTHSFVDKAFDALNYTEILHKDIYLLGAITLHNEKTSGINVRGVRVHSEMVKVLLFLLELFVIL